MITIRRATRDDAPVLADFQIRLADETESVTLDREVVQQGMLALFNDAYKGFYNVAEKGNEIIACHMVTYEWSDWRNGTIWWLQSVYVKPEYRKQGVFKKMYAALMEKVNQSPDVLGLRLYVDKTNMAAQKTYEAQGMNGSHYTVYEWMR